MPHRWAHWGGTRSRALWVNDDGLIVGESTDANEHELAFLFADGQMIGLPALPSTNPEAAALAVNISGQIVGYSVNASGKFRAVRWIGGGPAKDIAPMWQGEAMATAINDAGQICPVMFWSVAELCRRRSVAGR
ncbi:MAG: hypothetical protein R2839_01705 [Thermomicrobiales bacterium]